MRQPARQKRPAKTELGETRRLASPIRGWNTKDAKADMGPLYATMLQNIFPDSTDCKLRKGAADWVTGFASPLRALLSYNAADGSANLFGATDDGLFLCDALGAVGAASTVLTSGLVQAVNFRTTGNSFLPVVNGADSYRYWDGSSWTTQASLAITGGGTLTTSTIASLCAFKKRLFFGIKNSMDVYSLPVDSITGTVDFLPLGSLFTKGGAIVAMADWTIDGGNGIDDRLVIATSKGELAVYQGTDPTDPTQWALVGIYYVGEPLGLQPFLKAGGDVLYLCQKGVFPLSVGLQNNFIKATVTNLIAPTVNDATTRYRANFGWAMEIDTNSNMLLVNIPQTAFSASTQYVQNLTSGAWCSFLGWNATCFTYHEGQLYMGLKDKVAKANVGTADFTGTIVGVGRQAYQELVAGRNSFVNAIRPIFSLSGSVSVEEGLDVDYQDGNGWGPTSFLSAPGALWNPGGDGIWGPDPAGSKWGGSQSVITSWQTVTVQSGMAASLRLRLTSKSGTVAWAATDIRFEAGSPM